MPQLLFDVYVTQKFTHLFGLYIRGREHAWINDQVLTEVKLSILIPWMRKLRDKKYTANERTLDIAYNELLTELSTLKTSLTNERKKFNDLKGTAYGPAGLEAVIEYAEKLLEHLKNLYIIFGVDKATNLNINVDISARYELLQTSLEQLHFPLKMQPEDWKQIDEFYKKLDEASKVEQADGPTQLTFLKLKTACDQFFEEVEKDCLERAKAFSLLGFAGQVLTRGYSMIKGYLSNSNAVAATENNNANVAPVPAVEKQSPAADASKDKPKNVDATPATTPAVDSSLDKPLTNSNTMLPILNLSPSAERKKSEENRQKDSLSTHAHLS